MREVCCLIVTRASWTLLEASFWHCFFVCSMRGSVVRLSSEGEIIKLGRTVDRTALGSNIHRNNTIRVTFALLTR